MDALLDRPAMPHEPALEQEQLVVGEPAATPGMFDHRARLVTGHQGVSAKRKIPRRKQRGGHRIGSVAGMVQLLGDQCAQSP